MSFFSNLFAKKDNNDSVLGIDIGSSAIKIVQLKKKNGQAILETYGELALGPYAGAMIGQATILPSDKLIIALKDLMQEKEVNITTRKCAVSIPFASALLSVIELPQVSNKQLASMVPLEARKYIPVPISEVMLDWSIVPKTEIKREDTPEGTPADSIAVTKIDVMIVAIHNDTIAKYNSVIAGAGLDAGFFEIEIFSTMRAVLDEAFAPVMIMDFGAATTKIYIIERGLIKASHTINRGSQDITQTLSKALTLPIDKAEMMKRAVGLTGADQTFTDVIVLTLDYIFAEANRALLSFEKKYNKTVSKVILVGGGAALKGLADLAKKNFNTDAIAGNPFSKVATPAFLEKVLNETGPEFTVAIGIALRELQESE